MAEEVNMYELYKSATDLFIEILEDEVGSQVLIQRLIEESYSDDEILALGFDEDDLVEVHEMLDGDD